VLSGCLLYASTRRASPNLNVFSAHYVSYSRLLHQYVTLCINVYSSNTRVFYIVKMSTMEHTVYIMTVKTTEDEWAGAICQEYGSSRMLQQYLSSKQTRFETIEYKYNIHHIVDIISVKQFSFSSPEEMVKCTLACEAGADHIFRPERLSTTSIILNSNDLKRCEQEQKQETEVEQSAKQEAAPKRNKRKVNVSTLLVGGSSKRRKEIHEVPFERMEKKPASDVKLNSYQWMNLLFGGSIELDPAAWRRAEIRFRDIINIDQFMHLLNGPNTLYGTPSQLVWEQMATDPMYWMSQHYNMVTGPTCACPEKYSDDNARIHQDTPIIPSASI